MPFSLRSTSFCFLACLCSYSYGLASSPQVLTPNIIIPFKGDDIYLNGDCVFASVYAGAEQESIISSDGQNLTIVGQNHTLSFTNSQGPVLQNCSFISAEEKISLRDFSSLMFSKNISCGEKGMIAGKTVSISGGDSIVFKDNSVGYSSLPSVGQTPTTPIVGDVLKGSIFCVETGLEISGVKKELVFDNTAGNFGAVFCSSAAQGDTTFTVKDCKGKILFQDNVGSCGGGVIYKGEVLFQDNEGEMLFRGNSAHDDLGILDANPQPPTEVGGGGGVICTPEKTVTFKGNKGPITFDYNFAKGRGGAIQSQTFSLVADSAVVFSNNTAEKGGGAIYALEVNVSTNGGSILFEGNRASEGGAICVSEPIAANNGGLTLHAADGDIIFSKNMTSDRPGERSAIRILDSGTNVSLNASGASKMIFYDPVVQNNPATPPTGTSGEIKINESGSGSVVFTAETLTPSEKLSVVNATSNFPGNLTVSSGELVVTKGATLTVGNITATSGRVTLGSGASLSAVAGTAGTCTVSKLGIDLESFLVPTYETAKLGADTTVAVNNNPTLDLVMANETEMYDNPLFMNAVTIPFVTLVSLQTTGGVTTSAVTLNNADTAHYGYQGSWSADWRRPPLAPDPSGMTPLDKSNTLYVTWRPSSNYGVYKLDPQRRGELVPNSLWVSGSALRTFTNGLKEHYVSRDVGFIASVQALGDYVLNYKQGNRDGFLARYGGFQAVAASHYENGGIFGVAFGQLYGQTKSRLYDSKDAGNITILSCFGRSYIDVKGTETIVYWETAYGYSVHRMHTQYFNGKTNKFDHSKCRWHNNSYYAFVGAEHNFLEYCIPTRQLARDYDLTGFMRFEMSGGWSSGSKETGALPRHFDRGTGHNMSLPIGVVAHAVSNGRRSPPSKLTINMGYRPDVWRVTPHCNMKIIANGIKTPIQGSPLARHAFFLEVHDTLYVRHLGRAYMNYSLDARHRQTTHFVSLGLNRIF
jgi:Autotransporter beta-domain./Chlamydia polymorphic membrane protein (Chlamydia_PMP)./Chlamydia polymorphic membrane protein middle domain.